MDWSVLLSVSLFCNQTSIAKRKLRGSPARGAAASPVSPMQARLSRGFPPSGVRPSEHQQAKRVAAGAVGAASTSSSSSSPGSGCITRSSEQTGPSFSEGEAPPPLPPPAQQQAQRKEEEGVPGMMGIGAEERGGTEQEDGPPALASLGSAPAPPAPSKNRGGGGSQQQQPKKKDLNDMMLKARKASDNIRLLLHAKVRWRRRWIDSRRKKKRSQTNMELSLWAGDLFDWLSFSAGCVHFVCS